MSAALAVAYREQWFLIPLAICSEHGCRGLVGCFRHLTYDTLFPVMLSEKTSVLARGLLSTNRDDGCSDLTHVLAAAGLEMAPFAPKTVFLRLKSHNRKGKLTPSSLRCRAGALAQPSLFPRGVHD